jgi:hypothetical protein
LDVLEIDGRSSALNDLERPASISN